jgi:hypothetical protein
MNALRLQLEHAMCQFTRADFLSISKLAYGEVLTKNAAEIAE